MSNAAVGAAPGLGRQWSIRSVLIAVLAVAPLFGLMRLDPYFGAMTAAYISIFCALAYSAQRAGGVAAPLAVAIGTSLLLIAGWCPIRQFTFREMIRQFEPAYYAALGSRMRLFSRNELFVRRLSTWESWSLLRWWLLFGAIAWFGGPAADRPGRARALLGFAWAFLLLEIGGLLGTWLALGEILIVPEPQSMFLRGSTFAVALRWPRLEFWAIRTAAPTLVMGYVFYRVVMRARWWAAILGCLLLVPVVVVQSITWSILYHWMRDYWFLIR